MARALGIGGAFFKAKDPKRLATWYSEALGLGSLGPSSTRSFGIPLDPRKLPENAYVQLSAVPLDSKHFSTSFMFNFVVDDLAGVLARIEELGGTILRTEFHLEGVGEFAWFKDPEGNQVELWEPHSD